MYKDKTEQILNGGAHATAPMRAPRLSMPAPDHNGGCGCASCCGSAWGLHEYPLGSVYSPCQEWRNLYSPTKALAKGTLFTELDLPFEGKNCMGGRGCRG